jgi:hypothetical protein
LRELSRSYQTINKDLTRVINRLKALYRGAGLSAFPAANNRKSPAVSGIVRKQNLPRVSHASSLSAWISSREPLFSRSLDNIACGPVNPGFAGNHRTRKDVTDGFECESY